jgi:uncharacterized repeat protein (TIGR04076 family)
MSAVEVKSQKGEFVLGHEIGDVIVFDGRTVEGPDLSQCSVGLNSENLRITFQRRISMEPDKNVGYCVCPDAENPVVFEI